MKHRLWTFQLLIAASIALPGSILLAQESEPTLTKIVRSGEFVIGYRADSSPLSYENADGEPSGYSVDFCRRVAASIKALFPESKIETKFVRINSSDRLSAVVSGKIDIECGSTTITLSRQEQVDFSLPTFVTGGSILSLSSSGIHDVSNLSGKKVGVTQGTTTDHQLRTHLEEKLIDAEIVFVENRNAGMGLLNAGEIDALASDQIVLIGQVIEARNPDKYSIISEIYSYEPYGFVVRRNDADFRLAVNRAIAQIYRSGEHGDIFYKWIGRIGISVPPILAAMYQLSAIPE